MADQFQTVPTGASQLDGTLRRVVLPVLEEMKAEIARLRSAIEKLEKANNSRGK